MSRARFIDAQGRLLARRKGVPQDWVRDLYHTLLGMPWPGFVGLTASVFLTLNLIFASLYWLLGDTIQGSQPGAFSDCFFFSVHTLATIGYGTMAPKGLAGNLLVCVEAYVGLMSFAMLSGLAFAKFSVPRTRVLFSQTMCLGRRDGVPHLMFRMANMRGNQIVEAHVNLTMAFNDTTAEGDFLRRLQRLPLVTADSPIFALSFLAAHRVDESSPLYGKTPEQWAECNCEFIVTLIGLDDTLGQTVHGRAAYQYEQIRFGHRFVDTLSVDEMGIPTLDLTHFHETQPLEPTGSASTTE